MFDKNKITKITLPTSRINCALFVKSYVEIRIFLLGFGCFISADGDSWQNNT